MAENSLPRVAPSGDEVFRLAKVVGAFAILASGVSQEYGAGINFVMVNSVGSYPKVTYLVPWAMLAAGILLLPKIGLYMRFSSVIPRAGSTYVWMTRSINRPVGFVVAFLWVVGVVGAMGFLAYTFDLFFAGFLQGIGLPSAWALTSGGHVLVGGLLILGVFWLHYSGVGNYGRFVTLIFVLILVAAATVVFYGFSTSASAFMDHVTKVLGATPTAPADQAPSLGAFISVITVFIFAYAGITASTSLGGEAKDATRSMPRAILWAWVTALVLYTLVAFAIFNAVPWWTVQPLVKAGHATLATTPGLVGLVAPQAIGTFLNLLVTVIVGKTVAPGMLDCSRFFFAWAQDGLLPKGFLHTARSKAPDVALGVTALLAFAFLLEATFVGWSIAVVLRSISVVLVFGAVGVGALNLRFNPAFREVEWARRIAGHRDTPVAAVLAILVALVLLSSVIVVPNTVIWFQPSFQAVVAIVVAALIYVAAVRRRVDGLAWSPRDLPIE